jgi:hypothetical protein
MNLREAAGPEAQPSLLAPVRQKPLAKGCGNATHLVTQRRSALAYLVPAKNKT